MIRVTSGIAKNKKILLPPTEDVKAVQDVVRQAVFSIIGDQIKKSSCLDLYSGSGIMGIEALSRGATSCDFVDLSNEAVETIISNLKTTGFTPDAYFEDETQFNVFHTDAIKFVVKVGKTRRKYNVIFADPYYENTAMKYLFKNLDHVLAKQGTLIFLHGENLNIPETISATKLKVQTQRKFGKTIVTILNH